MAEIDDAFDRAEAYSGLSLDLLEPELAARVTDAIRRVTAGILSGEIRSGIYDQPYGYALTVEQYRESLKLLLETIPSDGAGNVQSEGYSTE
jgi:hypothetical protein